MKHSDASPLISIALCTYNGTRHIHEQMDSIINQTYINIEVVAVDDCSTDDTLAILEKYAAQDKRIKVWVNEHNLGFNKNFEKALSLAKGQYIAISDQDDIWEFNKIQILKDSIAGNWLAFSNSTYINQQGKLTGKLLNNHLELSGKTFTDFITQNYVTGHTTLLSRELLQYILPIPEQGFYDWWIGFIAIYHQKIVYVDQVLTCYREHYQSVIGQMHHNRDDAAIMKMVDNIQIRQIAALLGYKNLSTKDRLLLQRFEKMFHYREQKRLSVNLIKLIYAHYPALFPKMKQRKGLSRLNFAFKYLRGRA
jgi:glycosyltransferase involved in cell wall biosynthesis